MAILEKEVWVKLNNNTYQYFLKLGYEIPRELFKGKLIIKRNTEILIKVDHLNPSSHVRLTKICDDCGEHTQNQEYRNIIKHRKSFDNKDRCVTCGQKMRDIIRKSNIKYEKSLEWYAKNNNKVYLLGEFSSKNKRNSKEISYGTHDKFLWNCEFCNEEYSAQVNNRTNGSGCPICNNSKGEKEIENWLIKNNISYETQRKFGELKGLNNGLLSYDFYLPNYNLLIEYQGEFHDGSSRGYTKRNLDKQQEHDKRKREYANINNINLLEIWYWDFENIESILKGRLNDRNQ